MGGVGGHAIVQHKPGFVFPDSTFSNLLCILRLYSVTIPSTATAKPTTPIYLTHVLHHHALVPAQPHPAHTSARPRQSSAHLTFQSCLPFHDCR